MTTITLLKIELKKIKQDLIHQENSLLNEYDSFFVRILRKRIGNNKKYISDIEYAINLLKEDRNRIKNGWKKLENSGLDKEIEVKL